MSIFNGLSTRSPSSLRKTGPSLLESIAGFEYISLEPGDLGKEGTEGSELATWGSTAEAEAVIGKGVAMALLVSCEPNTVLSLRVRVKPRAAICG